MLEKMFRVARINNKEIKALELKVFESDDYNLVRDIMMKKRNIILIKNMFKPQADFLLKVYGQSMKDIGILDGDLLAVHSTKDVRNGQIVVARIEDEVTVKRLEKKGSIIYLHAENEEFDPIVVNLEEQENFEIEGIAVGIIRNNAWM